eukprot:12111196-Ditylum_brightwellii.AAC.1
MMAEEEDEVSKKLSFDDVEPTVGDKIQTLQDTMDKQRQEIRDLRRTLESEIDEASETQSDLLENVDIS